MKRHHVILGTKTTAGGEVISASSTRSLNGVKFALEGDKIYCPACKSEGVIRCHGPRLGDTWNGINFALEHDLCLCKCKTPPTLLTAQSLSSQTVDGSGFASSAAHAPPVAAPFDEQVALSAEVLWSEGLPYYILAGAKAISGRVDSTGRLPRVKTEAEAEYLMWIGDEALSKMTGDSA